MGYAQDKRLEWVGDKTCQGLGVTTELFQQLLGECPSIEEQLIKYLDGGERTPSGTLDQNLIQSSDRLVAQGALAGSCCADIFGLMSVMQRKE